MGRTVAFAEMKELLRITRQRWIICEFEENKMRRSILLSLIVLTFPFVLLAQVKTVQEYIDQVTASLRRWNKMLHVEPEALEKLVADGYSMAYGARFLKRVIDDQIKLPLSQRWKEANTFRAVVRDNQIAVEAVGPRLVTATDQAIAV